MFAQNFASCILKPYEGNDRSPAVVRNPKGKWSTTSWYIDSFGRASVQLPLQLVFTSPSVLDSFVAEKSIHPIPLNVGDDPSAPSRSESPRDTAPPGLPEKVISLEAKVNLTFGTGHAITSRVESVSIVSTRIEEDGHSIVLETEVILRVSNVDEALDGSGFMDPVEASNVKINLEITAALIEKDSSQQVSTPLLDEFMRLDLTSTFLPRKALSVTRTAPFSLQVALIHALEIQIRSVPGPMMGNTLVALQMSHSNRHPHDLTITNIVLHPEAATSSALSGNSSLSRSGLDIQNSVHWGFVAEQHEPFPLILQRNEAHSTILSIDAANNSCAASYSCPLTISVTIGSNHRPIVVSSDVIWTTRCVAMEESDSFRIQMNLEDSDGPFMVGSPFTVHLEISNLSFESRQLKLLLDTNDTQGPWTVVSERDGYRFSLSGPDGDGHMLAVDTALLLGELKGFSSTQAKVRVIPLKKGTLSIPNFKLVDNRTGQRYQCEHKLQAVIQ